MKKLMLCLLCLALIFSGCQAQPVETTAAPTVVPTETQPAETEAPVEVKVPPVREPLNRGLNYDDPNWFHNAMVIDIDGDWPAIYLMDDMTTKERMVARASDYFNSLKGTNVTDVTICAFEQISYIPSETMEWVHEKAANIVAEQGVLSLASY